MEKAGAISLPGFLLSGFLFALLGVLLPAWGYHLDPSYAHPAQYFLALGIGLTLATFLTRRFQLRIGVILPAGSTLAWASLLFLSLVAPPAPFGLRLVGWILIGLANGLLHAGLFENLRDVYQKDPAGTINAAGIWFAIGCLLSTLLVAGTYYLYSVTTILLLSAAVPGFFAYSYYRKYGKGGQTITPPAAPAALRDFLSAGSLLFALLLFFQSGNEWALAGWLPIYLIRRLGMSPEGAIWTLALFWLAMIAGRFASIYLLPKVRHSRLLTSSATAALFGCVLLMFAANRLGATVGVLLCGSGFALIYPLVVERAARRFPNYHPGVFTGVFSLVIVGGMFAPWSIGMLADGWGAWVVMGLPVLGTFLVVFLLLLIWLESKVTGRE